MNEDSLAKNLKVVFDEISQEYVVTDALSESSLNSSAKKNAKPFSFLTKLFSQQQNQSQEEQPDPVQRPPQPNRPPLPQSPPPPRPLPPRPTPPPRPVPPPPANHAVRLSRDIYNDLDALVNAYSDLIELDDRDSQRLENLRSQTLIMRATMGNIYRTLSGNPLPPFENRKLKLTDNYCASLKNVADFIDEIIDKMINLMRLVAIPAIDRQLLILNAALSSQQRALTNLYNDCRVRESGL